LYRKGGAQVVEGGTAFFGDRAGVSVPSVISPANADRMGINAGGRRFFRRTIFSIHHKMAGILGTAFAYSVVGINRIATAAARKNSKNGRFLSICEYY
jgi:hypothetical protein